jgi:hypothetical protein
MKIILDHPYKSPVTVKMVTTSGGNKEAGKRVEIANMLISLIGRGVGDDLLPKDLILGIVGENKREVYFTVQRHTPYAITAISLKLQDLEDMPMPEVGKPVDWVWHSIKILRPPSTEDFLA